MAILNVWLIYAASLCLRVSNLFKVATAFFSTTLAILSVSVATLKAIFDQLHYRQLPHPPARASFLSDRVLPIHDHVEELLGTPQSLLRYPGIVRPLDDLFRRQRTVCEHLVQELDSFASRVGVFVVLWRSEKVFGRYLRLPEPVDPHRAALGFLEAKHQALWGHREVVFRGCQHVPIFVLRVLTDHESHARRPDDADASSASVQWVVRRSLVQVPHHQHARSCPFRKARKRCQSTPHVLVTVAVSVVGEKGHERVHDHQTGPYAPYALLYEPQVFRYGEQAVVPVLIGNRREGEYLR